MRFARHTDTYHSLGAEKGPEPQLFEMLIFWGRRSSKSLELQSPTNIRNLFKKEKLEKDRENRKYLEYKRNFCSKHVSFLASLPCLHASCCQRSILRPGRHPWPLVARRSAARRTSWNTLFRTNLGTSVRFTSHHVSTRDSWIISI